MKTTNETKKEYKTGETFLYNKKEYKVVHIGYNRITAKPTEQPSPIQLVLNPEQFERITGGYVITETKDQYSERIQDEDLINKLNAIRYTNGQTAKQVYDEYMANGYTQIKALKEGAVNKYYLFNEATNGLVPVSGICRTYVTKVLSK